MRTGPLLVVAAVLLALVGCVPTASQPSASPSTSATPVFASDAEALAAAEKAYAAYLKVSDQIANDGGKDPGRIAELVTRDRLTIEIRGSKSLADHDVHTTGLTSFSNASLEQVSTSGDETAVTFYACWDASAVRVINSVGGDVTPSERTNDKTLEIVLTTQGGKLPLVLESDDPWSGSSSC